ncbi:MAG: class II glutamine amidotransferase [Caldisphaeraceae archaeon]|nr:class II glutamine amidotransferase [Caldisphaeraceae archaeon]
MCRLFGLYANKLVNVSFSFFESPVGSFVELSHKNPSGWGVAYLNDVGWHIYKEPLPLYSSDNAEKVIRKSVCGRIIVSHVRLASVGSAIKKNTHPWQYRNWVFAHNGTIYDKQALLELVRKDYQDFGECFIDSNKRNI